LGQCVTSSTSDNALAPKFWLAACEIGCPKNSTEIEYLFARGRVAVIRVGGATEVEVNERKDREDNSVIGKVLEKEQYAYGFDAQNGEYGNLVTKGIIDPTKVVRTAIQNASSVAGLLITTEAMIAELPKKSAPAAGMPRAAAWAAWTSESASLKRLRDYRTPAAMPGFLFWARTH
jgi:TCP-1/cpn60 chaperonin family